MEATPHTNTPLQPGKGRGRGGREREGERKGRGASAAASAARGGSQAGSRGTYSLRAAGLRRWMLGELNATLRCQPGGGYLKGRRGAEAAASCRESRARPGPGSSLPAGPGRSRSERSGARPPPPSSRPPLAPPANGRRTPQAPSPPRPAPPRGAAGPPGPHGVSAAAPPL